MTLNDFLSLGPLSVPYWLLAVVLAAVSLQVALTLTLKKEAKTWGNTVWNAAALGFALWKLSPLVGSWDQIAKEPLSLLYLPGTSLGLSLGVTAALGWVGWRVWKAPEKQRKKLGISIISSLGASALGVLAFAVVLGLFPGNKPEVPKDSLVLATFEGQQMALGEVPGKVLFVNFWATWCPPCRAEIPEYVAFSAQADPAKVAIQAVDLVASEQNPDRVPAFAAAAGMKFPLLRDDQNRAALKYQITSIPTTLVFGPDGQLVYQHTGAMNREMLEALVRQYQK